eukprot:3197068-Amphidinium_carterae.1
MPDPVECFHSLADHAAMTGRKFSPGYATAFEAASMRSIRSRSDFVVAGVLVLNTSKRPSLQRFGRLFP